MNQSNDAQRGGVYVQRAGDGHVVSISREPASEHPEWCAPDHADVVAFIGAIAPGNPALLASDLALIRVLEDLVDVLIQKEVLRLTDLPERAQAKLLSRRHLRASLRSLHLLGDDNNVPV